MRGCRWASGVCAFGLALVDRCIGVCGVGVLVVVPDGCSVVVSSILVHFAFFSLYLSLSAVARYIAPSESVGRCRGERLEQKKCKKIDSRVVTGSSTILYQACFPPRRSTRRMRLFEQLPKKGANNDIRQRMAQSH